MTTSEGYDDDPPLWEPSTAELATGPLAEFIDAVAVRHQQHFDGYLDAWRWSTTNIEAFWAEVCRFFDVDECSGRGDVLDTHAMPGAKWYAGAELNYAEHALRHRGGAPALVARSHTRQLIEWSWADLDEQVGRVRAGLVAHGVGRGDRVVAYLPNVPETVAALLATASLGAIFSTCAPEFGVQAVLDRFTQIEPKVLLAVDGYRYGAKDVDRRDEAAAIRAGLPTLQATVILQYLHPGSTLAEGIESWAQFTANTGAVPFERVPFDHPLYVLYSSGTTGLPKPIVHCHGGILLAHLKDLGLMSDMTAADRFFWFTTTGWMMWNYLVSGLLVGATVVLFDGDPAFPDLSALWHLAAEERVTYFGVSAPFLHTCMKAGLRPGEAFDLGALRGVGSTGAPLSADGFRWVYDAVSASVVLSPISGGTDVCSAFVGGCSHVPVRAGVIPCPSLGNAVAAFDEGGHPVVGQQGELVITEPLPSMPVGFWGDADGTRYRAAYFEHYPGVWRHGDWITIDSDGGSVISGRSDATLNRSGVRIGTAEIYRVVEAVPAVDDSLIVHLEDPSGEGPGRLVLFVATDGSLDEVAGEVKRALRSALSPRHVPDEVYRLPSIPTTLSGKKLELPVKKILLGAAPDDVCSRGALKNPDSLDAVVEIAAARQ